MSSRSFSPYRHCSLAACLALAAMTSQAQTQPSNAAGEAVKAAPLSDADRAKRDADKVFQWIKFHAEKPDTKKPVEKHEAKAEARPEPKPLAKPVAAAPAAALVATRRMEADPAAERPLQRASAAMPAETVAVAPSAAPSVTETASAQSEAPPTVVAMAAPASTARAGTPAMAPPPEPEPLPEAEAAPLRLIKKVDPEYPRGMSGARSGSVMVRFTVLPDGSVTNAEATKSPDRKLSSSAVNAVKQWRFDPINAPRQVAVEIGFQFE